MFNFVWNFNKEDFEKCKKQNAGDYVGNVRVGDICFDILQIEYDDSLWIDPYVGGVDTGYGYGKDNYPYDYVIEIGTSMERDEYENLTYEQFVEEIETHLTDNINRKIKYTAENGEVVNLIDKANEPLGVW